MINGACWDCVYLETTAEGGFFCGYETQCEDKYMFKGKSGQKKQEVPLPEYIARKIKILNQLHIYLTTEERGHIHSLTSEIAVDNYAHKLIMNRNR